MPEMAQKLMFQPAESLAQAGDPDVVTIDQQPGEAQPAGARQSPGGEDRKRDK